MNSYGKTGLPQERGTAHVGIQTIPTSGHLIARTCGHSWQCDA